MSEVHISSVFLNIERESRSARSEIAACKFFCAMSVVTDAQDVVSRARSHAPSCENALIFSLLV
jgi:hypothetical protein